LILPSFPIHAFPTGIEPYRPPHSIKDSQISKITCCDDTFAALSSNGEVFTFSAPSSTSDTNPGEGRAFKPQRVWALRKKFSAVKVSLFCCRVLSSFSFLNRFRTLLLVRMAPLLSARSQGMFSSARGIRRVRAGKRSNSSGCRLFSELRRFAPIVPGRSAR
jgi:hypothetical protein